VSVKASPSFPCCEDKEEDEDDEEEEKEEEEERAWVVVHTLSMHAGCDSRYHGTHLRGFRDKVVELLEPFFRAIAEEAKDHVQRSRTPLCVETVVW
jgi:hypothetical protein